MSPRRQAFVLHGVCPTKIVAFVKIENNEEQHSIIASETNLGDLQQVNCADSEYETHESLGHQVSVIQGVSLKICLMLKNTKT
jgi:hypothetical protein